ncbi:sulfatase-like hydrolase/transferase [Paraburkholderia fungorum]|jgi:arylsulfatase A-like enzyme|uniref:arylsulfatase n=1 Tax=Paraburkholderia fungorum TaxID=134537 RepID=UPI0038B7FEC3
MKSSMIYTSGLVSVGMLTACSATSTQEALPFPPTPSASTVGKTLADSKNVWRQPQSHLSPDAPNVLIIMLDDAGFAQSDTVGGEIHTPTLTRIAQTGITYNAFHTTAISSATRASLLTGRNHHRVGFGQIAELSADFDGYVGVLPKTSATVAEVLKDYGYSTVALGKWHNTPPSETTAMGPFDHWPTAYGFQHFYGFISGESDQYKPRLFNDTTPVEPPNDPKYNLTEDLANQGVNWLRERQAYAPNKPFMMYWAPGAVHGPHQVSKEWADKYKGKFDSGWDAYRERVFERQKAMGWIPKDTKLTPRPAEMAAWDSLSPEEKKFQARLMEVYAGFLEQADTQAGRLVDELERQGIRDNTLIFYVFSDNGASSEGMQGTISELLAQNGIPVPPQQQMKALNTMYGGLDALGGPKVHNMYNAAWAWAGSSPFVGTKLVAGYFGGTRVPLAVSWPRKIKPDGIVRTQFEHVNDIAPTIYDAAGIEPPSEVNGVRQDPIDGISMTYTFADAHAPGRKGAQYFEMMGSRAEYSDGWVASVFGPRKPWQAGLAGLQNWDPNKDQWALYNVNADYSQSTDLSAQYPEKLEALKRQFDKDATANKVYPVGGGLYAILHLGEQHGGTRADWHFAGSISRLPEFAAPNIRSRHNAVTVDAELPAHANGVLFALGGMSGGITLYMQDGFLVYEYNGLAIQRTRVRLSEPLQAGHHVIEVELTPTARKPASPATVTLRVDGTEAARGTVPFTVPLAFTSDETFDVGRDLGSPVSTEYFDRAPFAFDGRISDVHVRYLP